MNIRDSEFVMGLMLDDGYKRAGSAEDADVILFNSCSVRQHAEDRLFSNISDLKKLKKRKPEIVIGLMGCTAQEHKDNILRKIPLVDLVCGPGNEVDLPRLIKDVVKNRCPIIAADKVNELRPEKFPEYREGGFKAFVSIGEGCNNFCSYCIVPYVRGAERSRDAKDIIKEVKDLAARGFKEITLLGQNVNSFKLKTYNLKLTTSNRANDFVRLLEALNKIKGIERIRFMTSHPKDASTELFEAMRDLEKVCEHLHLPLQSGSDRILKLMNRGYNAAHYLKLSESYRKIVHGGSITTDVIVGFPSEREADFKKTVEMMETVRFESAFMFKYSPRPPAKSARLKDDVPADVKQRRLQKILDLQCKISEEYNKSLVGATVEALSDTFHAKDKSLITGRTRTNRITLFDGDKDCIGSLVNVKIGSATPHALKGRRV